MCHKIVATLMMGTLMILSAEMAQAQWTSVSGDLPETEIRFSTVDPKNSNHLYAASIRRVYRSQDGGASWKRVWSDRSNQAEIRGLSFHPRKTGTIAVCSNRAVYLSKESGKNWKPLYRSPNENLKALYGLAWDRRDDNRLWVAGQEGLLAIHVESGEVQKISSLQGRPVRSILLKETFPDQIIVATDTGLFRSVDRGIHWSQETLPGLFLASESQETPAENLQQFNIEEMRLASAVPSAALVSANGANYLSSAKGILQSPELGSGEPWTPLKGENLPDRNIHFLAASSKTIYAATDHGVFQWDLSKGRFKDVSEGLVSRKTRSLFYDLSGDALYASTERGLFRWAHPEFEIPGSVPGLDSSGVPGATMSAEDLLKKFAQEPTIREVQNAAIQYAEVHPKKIQAWRSAAAKKALFPTVSMTGKFNKDQNIDIDRGGTADPDRFIDGPSERSQDWGVGASWDLGDLIWSDDQTSIDTRSRLMVELREEVLTEVTHLYFERRRLQVEMALSPIKDLPLQVEKLLRLEELTAGIDALTGGYLSERISREAIDKG